MHFYFYIYLGFYSQVNNDCATGSSALYLGKQLIEGGKILVNSNILLGNSHHINGFQKGPTKIKKIKLIGLLKLRMNYLKSKAS